jgi:hypothetical protein
VSKELPHLESVQFVNQDQKLIEAETKKKELAWLMIALNTVNELEIAFQEIFKRESILRLYNPEDSYFWRHRWDITQMIGVLKIKPRM